MAYKLCIRLTGFRTVVNSNYSKLSETLVQNRRLSLRSHSTLTPKNTKIPHVTSITRHKFHTSPKSNAPIGPVILLLIKKFIKVGAVIGGRHMRKRIAKHDDPHRSRTILKRFLVGLFGGTTLWLIGNYFYHIQTTPVTGRRRYVAYSNKQFLDISKQEMKDILDEHKGKMMEHEVAVYQWIANIVTKILAGNQDIELFREQNWHITLLDNPEKNAFVFPTGDIVVCRGILEILQTEDMVAAVLAHELAHVYLSHAAEKISVTGLWENIMIIMTLTLWALMPTDISAVLMNWLYHKFIDVLLHLPYSRMLEEEADEVGMELMAKACFDVREASNVWRRMEIDTILNEEEETPEFLSTHPKSVSRISRLDDMTHKAIQTRISCNCSTLTPQDPREEWRKIHQLAILTQEKRRKELEDGRSEKEKPQVVAVVNENRGA